MSDMIDEKAARAMLDEMIEEHLKTRKHASLLCVGRKVRMRADLRRHGVVRSVSSDLIEITLNSGGMITFHPREAAKRIEVKTDGVGTPLPEAPSK